MAKRCLNKIPDRVACAHSYHKIVRYLPLHHLPRGVHIFRRIAPVAPRVQISQIQFLLQSRFDPRNPARDFPRHKVLSPTRRLVVKQNPVHGKEVIRLAVIHGRVVRKHFGNPIGAARMKRCCFILRRGCYTKHFAGARLIKFYFLSRMVLKIFYRI